MKRIGILGDIGSGKTYIAKCFGYPVFNADQEVANLYKKDNKISDYVWPQTFQMEHTRFKRYMPNTEDRFDIHADATTKMTSSRFLVLFVYLSNNDSGHTSFPDRDIKVQPKQGRLLMFPPNWCYPHVGEKVTDKPKYIIRIPRD